MYRLQPGDKDSRHRWGGATRSNAGVRHVNDLQSDLMLLGCYSGKLDGDYGPVTETAVRLFQWNVLHVPFRLLNGNSFRLSAGTVGGVSGMVDAATHAELRQWKQRGWVTTGDLVKVNTGGFASLVLSSRFRSVLPQLPNGFLIASQDFAEDLAAMNSEASHLGIVVQVNQTFRVDGASLSGARYTPASRSQHKIGHAVDVNLLDAPSVNGFSEFRSGSETPAARSFVAAMKRRGLRWGGDWSSPDWIHYDRQVAATGFDYDAKFYFNQRSIGQQHPIQEWVLQRDR